MVLGFRVLGFRDLGYRFRILEVQASKPKNPNPKLEP